MSEEQKPMSQLQQEIYHNLLKAEGISHRGYEEGNPITASICKGHAEAASEVCLRWIQKALRDGSDPTFTDSKGRLMKKVQDLYVKEWIKENGLSALPPAPKQD